MDRANLQQIGRLCHVRVTGYDMQPSVLLCVGVRFVSGVDYRSRARRGRRDPLPNVLGSLAEYILSTPRGVEHFAGTNQNLSADQEWQ
jgi:hypothetical protein